MFRLFSFNEIAVSIDNGLWPGHQPPAGLPHGVPGVAGHGPGYLNLQEFSKVVRVPADLVLQKAPQKVVKQV